MSATDNELQLITFKIGNEVFTVDIKNVREVVNLKQITKVPKAPHYIEGVMNLRGKIITLVDLASLLGFNSNINDKSKVLIYSIDNNRDVGLVVDHVLGVLRISEKDVEKPVMEISSYIKGFIRNGNLIITLLNMDNIINELKDTLGYIKG